MNLGELAIRKKTSTLVVTAFLIVGGMMSYFQLGRLEDPEFTIKEAIIVTTYPGAAAEEVEREVTDVIERAVQQMGELKEISSTSQPELSIVQATMKDRNAGEELELLWNELRNKVGDAQVELPPGAGPSIVKDDFGDVYGVFLAITGQGYSYQELKQSAKYLQRELLLVKNVARIEIFGERDERIYVEMSRDKLSQFGISLEMVLALLSAKNLVTDAGQAYTAAERIQLRPTGSIDSVEEMSNLVISQFTPDGDRVLRLGDIATVTRGYMDPPSTIFRVNGQPAIGLAISTVKGGNVVDMGKDLQQCLDTLLPNLPFGIELHKIAMQSEIVTSAINGFMINLAEAVAIVFVVLMLAMGFHSGVLIGAVLVITIAGTLIGMNMLGILMERISLGALILALGMLVDNAIVIAEGMMFRLRRGEAILESVRVVVGQNALPLVGATLVTIFAFGSVGVSESTAGEMMHSLFVVIVLSLLLSWGTAVTITPLFCTWAYKPDKGSTGDYDLYQHGFLRCTANF
ncbi:transporter, AcrB/D/F family [Candidatus Vecturithrix granuli]|uniref:Transporter, AcrB/D/F family n=1 Tax=Vecturithrix granuli TaxID=1499967 RepID=A0A081C1S0_VECG1|nr:transporter, AcrB/D/F family [Candidatus Vecturithrix granuli]